MTKREKVIAETRAQLEAQREFQRFYVELAQALPVLSAAAVFLLGDRLMGIVAALPPKKRQREAYSELTRTVNEIVLPFGWLLDIKPMRAQSLSKWGDVPRNPIAIPELAREDAEGGG